ncbi:FIP1[V]-like protein [Abeliophyllum distichum]|uniref:FIP1[V]-like protein n=1 Tax=Abeliophyllum distichum TaxID=126358 RepID=A0ABD1QZ89_9LAMI
MIPGLSGTVENLGGENFEDELESEESEDDLQIVLNDNGHGPVLTEDEDGEDGKQLVIFADHPQPMMEEQKLDSDEPGAEGERKELGDTTKASEGGSAATTSLQLKIGYNNHAYHHHFHSQFKYVRPGAAPMPGAAPVVPVTFGRGRGDCRLEAIKGAGPMQKGFHPGYRMPAWGANTAGRGFCSGLDFTLPSHKTIFEVDIDSFEEKPWRRLGIDISYFFNFSLNEESWKDYCKQLEQLCLETSMQSKILVYESGRTGQEYDPDLPPELAAAVGIQDIPSKNINPGKTDVGTKDLARAHGRPPLPVGRPILVETGLGDRLPSMESRRPRMHDLDAIIEIVYQADDNDVAEQQEDDPLREDLRGLDETDNLQRDDTDRRRGFSQTNDGKKRDLVGRREKFMNSVRDDEIVEDGILHIPSEEPEKYHPCRELGVPREERCTEGRSIVISSNMTASSIKREKIMDYQEESFDIGDGKLSPLSSPISIGSVGEQTVGDSDMNHKTLVKDRSFEIDKEEMALDAAKIDTLEEENLMHSTQKQPSQDNDDREDSNAASSSENCKARSESSKDHWKFDDSVEDEVLQNKCSMRTDNVQRPVVDEDSARRRGRHERRETGTHHKGVKGRESSYVYRTGDLKSSLHRHAKRKSTDRRKESDISEGRCHRRDESLHGRSTRVDDSRKKEHGGEIESRHRSIFGESERSKRNEHHEPRKQLDNGCWRSARHYKDKGSVDEQSCNEKVVDVHRKRRKEEARVSQEHAETEEILHNHRESNSSRRKRERDDSSDQRKRDKRARLKDDDLHSVGKKENGSFQGKR